MPFKPRTLSQTVPVIVQTIAASEVAGGVGVYITVKPSPAVSVAALVEVMAPTALIPRPTLLVVTLTVGTPFEPEPQAVKAPVSCAHKPIAVLYGANSAKVTAALEREV